jgi:hypothetical protein
MREYPTIDETGNKYGKLTVIEKAPIDHKANCAVWFCTCDCGNTAIVRGKVLRAGEANSCGCLKSNGWGANKKPVGEAALHALIRNMKRNASVRNLPWNLTKSQVRTLIKQNCFYCGIPPCQEAKAPTYNGSYIYNGLDRVNNTKGYMMSNIVTCCWNCNKIKTDKTKDEFLNLIKRIYEHQLGPAGCTPGGTG